MREQHQRLVLTNGCFDLLHVGHVRYLQAARALGDALAVGLNSDVSVQRLKGRTRPYTSEAERAEILAALECIDFLTIFAEDTAELLVEEIRPALYVKGGDYSCDPDSPTFPPEGHVVEKYGGRVAILPHVPGRSTSALINRVRDLYGADR
ncbi:MAG: adenylyltransferase/cytidyltransferase family protein [Chloroflexota bacterium]|nr:adenylyltransferase/cytidyltransferase family protein [Chloroflexota bacterium]